jgi:O-antigen/teichoic acid export membrane protein
MSEQAVPDTSPITPPTPSMAPAEDAFAAGEAGGRVIRGGSLRVVGSLVGVLAGTISAPLVVRHLGEAGYGRYLTVGSIMFVVTALTEGGLANVAVRVFSAGDRQQRRSLVANLTGLRIALGVIGSIGAVGFGLIAGYEHVIVVGLALGAAGYFIGGIQGSYSVALSGTLRLGALAGIDTLRALATTLLLVTLVVAGSGLREFYAVVVVVQAIALVLTAMLVRGGVPLRPAFQRAQWWALARETALYALAATLGVIYFQVALITMSLIDPGKQTGYYAIAFRIVEIINGIPWLLASSVLPLLSVAAATDHARLRFISGRVFEGVVILGGWVALAMIVGASVGIDFIAGAKGAPSIPVLRIMGVGVIATYLVASWGFVLLSLRMYRQLVLANAGALVLAIVLSAILIPALHARGGAFTTVALEFSLAIAYMAMLARRGIVPPGGFVARFAVAIALGLGSGALLLLVSAILAVIAGSIVYFAALWSMRAIPSELIDVLPWRK